MRTMGLGLGKKEQHQAAVSLLLPVLDVSPCLLAPWLINTRAIHLSPQCRKITSEPVPF